MANFSKLYITDEGKWLLNLKMNSDKELLFTEMVMSDSKYDMVALEGLSDLDGIRQRVGIRKMSRTGNAIQIDSVFLNSDLEEGYFVNTLGIYARLGEDTPVLFAVAAEQTRAAYMPQRSQALSGMEIKLKITLENADNIIIQMDQSAMATMGDVLELESSMEQHVNDLDNPHHTDKMQVGLDRVDNTSDMEKPVSTSQQEAIDGAYQQATGYTDQKIADLINGAPGDLDTLGEIAKAMQDNGDVMVALNQAIGSKASEADFSGHAGNNTIHMTASERQAWNGKQTTTGDTKDNVVSFASSDTASPTGWSDVTLISSGEKHNSLWHKVSLFARNVRYLWKLMGSTSLNGIGDGTVTGAISQLNTGLTKNIRDTGWITLNADWGCKYRIKDGIFYLFLTTELPSAASTGRYNLGTIPMASLKALNVPYVGVSEVFNLGTIFVSQQGPNIVEFEVKVSNRWYSATLAIPVGYL